MTAAAKHGDAKVSKPGDRDLRSERVVEATRERVWRAFTEADQLAQWWARGHRMTVETLEVKPGGAWRFIEHDERGDYGFKGIFREVKAPELLSMTFEYDGMPGYISLQTLTLEDLGGGRTKVVSVMSFWSQAERDGMLEVGMEKGMNESYAALDRLLARG